jgi:hypothetical protein
MVQITDQGRLLNERSSKLALPATILSSLSAEETAQLARYLEILFKMGEKQMGVRDKMPLRPQTPLLVIDATNHKSGSRFMAGSRTLLRRTGQHKTHIYDTLVQLAQLFKPSFYSLRCRCFDDIRAHDLI